MDKALIPAITHFFRLYIRKETTMPRLPIPGTDSAQWGTLLNEFLRSSHHEDGTLRGIIEVVNVKNYGSDTAAINAAIARRNELGPGILYFPAGTYMIDPSRIL